MGSKALGRIGRLAVVGAVATGVLAAAPARASEAGGDATVVAIIDSGFTPYHWDFLASRMPQALDSDPANDLPLDQPPDTWLAGFPSSGSFTSYQAVNANLNETNPNVSLSGLYSADAVKWGQVKRSTATAVHYHWIPRTKVIGALTFAANGRVATQVNSHGWGTSSVSVGNLWGSCPECVAVFIQYGTAADGETAIEWALSQPWIDVITNSYGFSLAERDRLYSGSDTAAQRAASERGQTVLFSAGNGISNTFTIPNATLFSSQEGPDWIVTVGAVAPDGGSYSGHGKPADIAGLGGSYRSAYGATTVNGSGNFSGTSNATPTIAGTYARALYLARRDLGGASRTQSGGVIATGTPYTCGAARPACELGDGALTATELRTRLFEGAVHTAAGMNVGGSPAAPPVGEEEFLNEGYGTYRARMDGTAAWLAEFERVLAPLEGRALPPARPAGEAAWMIVDSFCRQEIWGPWSAGAYAAGTTALPGADPLFPVRSALEAACPSLFAPV